MNGRLSDRSLRIAFFDDRFNEAYGAQENLLLLAQLSEQMGHTAVVVTTEDGVLTDAATARGLEAKVVPAGNLLKRFERQIELSLSKDFAETALQGARFSRDLDQWLKAERIDVLVCAAVRPTLLALVSRVRRSIKVVLFAQNSTPFGKMAAACLPMTDAVASISTACISTFPSWTHAQVRTRMHDLASGRDLQAFRPDEHKPSSEGGLRILTVSSITVRKRIHDLIEAVRQATEQGVPVELTIVGGAIGPESEAYLEEQQRRVQELSLPVHFAGWQSDVRPYFAAADCFVLASENEGLPGVILEAMASALPVITTNAGGCADAVLDGETGLVVDIGDTRQMLKALSKMQDEKVRTEFGTAGQARALSHYSLDAFKERFGNVLAALFE